MICHRRSKKFSKGSLIKMNYLIDTHILLWWMADMPKLSKNVRDIIKREPIWVSTAAVWEIIIKKSIGKLKIPGDLDEQLQKNGFNLMDIKLHHVLALETLDNLHSDPFDRIQIAQAKTENLTFITADRRILKYSGFNTIDA